MRELMPGLGRTLRRFAPYLREQRGLLAGATLALLASTALRLFEPWPLKFVVDRVLAPTAAASGIAWFDALDATTLLALCAAALVFVVGCKSLAAYAGTIGFALAGSRVLTRVRGDLFRHLQGLSLSFHDRAKSGDLTIRLISDVGMLKETAVTAALPLAASTLVLAGMVAVMLWLHWELALIALLPLPLLALASVRTGRRIQEWSRKERKREGAMAASAAESLAAMRTVQALSLEEPLSASFAGTNQRSLKEGVMAKRLAAGLERSVDVLVAVATAAVLWYGALLVLRGALSVGELLVFLTYLKNSFRPVREYAKYTGRLSKASVAGERIVDLLDEVPEVREAPGAQQAPALAGAVRFEGVSFAYAGGPVVLDAVSLDVRAGERIAVTGASGVGKTTFASLLLRLYDPTGGRITIDGIDLRAMRIASLRRQISAVPQDNLLFAGSVHDNIALAAGDATRQQVEAAARLANAHDFIARLPEGYDTLVGERGATLSSGQRQRMAIARAALRASPILILDEPTVGLDRNNERGVIDALERLARGRTTFIVTHDLAFAATADRVLVLDDARIVEQGSHTELIARGGRYAALWRLQAGRHHRRADVAHAV